MIGVDRADERRFGDRLEPVRSSDSCERFCCREPHRRLLELPAQKLTGLLNRRLHRGLLFLRLGLDGDGSPGAGIGALLKANA